jgi:hypothetical protein
MFPMQAALAKLSLDIRPGSSAKFAAFLDTERQKWSSIVGPAHIKVE